MKRDSKLSQCLYIPKRLIVALLTSTGLLILTVIQTNFAITNSLILNPHDSKDIPLDDMQTPNTVVQIQFIKKTSFCNINFFLLNLVTKNKLDIS